MTSSTLESRQGYRPSDSFETFPFPRGLDPLEDIGERLYTARAAYMPSTQLGVTKNYNALKDPANTDPAIAHLRRDPRPPLHPQRPTRRRGATHRRSAACDEIEPR